MKLYYSTDQMIKIPYQSIKFNILGTLNIYYIQRQVGKQGLDNRKEPIPILSFKTVAEKKV